MASKIPPRVRKILEETERELKSVYQDRLKELILFGSYARGDSVEGSDIDLVLLFEPLPDVYAERKKYHPILSRISLKYDTVVSAVPFDYREFQRQRTPLILNINKEGIKI